jgi:hypothetical protein
MSLLTGFRKLKIGSNEPEDWPQGKVVLPKGWSGIEVERLWLRGRPARWWRNRESPRASFLGTDKHA